MVRAALVTVHPTWITITLIDREARCDSARLSENDTGMQIRVPSGPDNDFFTDRDIPIALALHGAGGISRIRAGHATARIDKFDPESAETVHGRLAFRFRTAHDVDAPSYGASGPFHATVCNNLKTRPSIKELPTDQCPVAGNVGLRKVELRTVLAYLRPDGYGGQIVMLKGYERDVPCHTTRSATPYLFGAEFGPGTDGKYFSGKKLPTDWLMQMRMDEFSERSVQAGHGASWIQIDSLDVRQGGVVRGQLAADNSDDDKEWSFSLSGSFEGKVCGIEREAW